MSMGYQLYTCTKSIRKAHSINPANRNLIAELKLALRTGRGFGDISYMGTYAEIASVHFFTSSSTV